MIPQSINFLLRLLAIVGAGLLMMVGLAILGAVIGSSFYTVAIQPAVTANEYGWAWAKLVAASTGMVLLWWLTKLAIGLIRKGKVV